MKYRVTLNGRTYEVEVEAGKAMLLDEYEAYAPAPAPVSPAAPADPGLTAPEKPAAPAAPAGGEPVLSPMPGVIVKVCAGVGDTVREGDTLVVLEAMKMENEIVAPKAGTVQQIVCKVGDKVDSGAPLAFLA